MFSYHRAKLTPMPRICTNCANRPFRIEKTIKTLTFFWFACCTLTGRQFCVFLSKANKIKIIIIIINLIKCEVRFAIFENRKIFPVVTFVQKLCHSKGLSMCFKNWCLKTEFIYLIGCQPRFLKITSEWLNRVWPDKMFKLSNNY